MPSGITDPGAAVRKNGAAPSDEYLRRETYAEKLDRNWAEILQELRILQTGLQLIAGFLLTLPFQARFATLDAYGVWLYLINVLTAAAALAVVLMPLSVHRWLFRRQVKNRLVSSGAWAAKLGLALAAMLIVGTTAFIFDTVLGRMESWIAGGSLLLLCLVMFIAVPASLLRGVGSERFARPDEPGREADG
ncbi:DUF6328 family protein [Sinomonas mesophila]|uniref:DUF6328 family protein n=1 Tax=Sinomonas mesophila TaxID=1531955 RepID=UPI001FE8FDEC|nr:DUF6328 family protein [Sinomonas mesophila]